MSAPLPVPWGYYQSDIPAALDDRPRPMAKAPDTLRKKFSDLSIGGLPDHLPLDEGASFRQIQETGRPNDAIYAYFPRDG